MDWKTIWIILFGTLDFAGLNMGFWVSNAAVLLIVIVMNVVFWNQKPQQNSLGS